MQILAPLFLLGILLVVLPFWLHRLQTETPRRQSFASSMFLNATEHPVHVRRKLRHILLMAARMLFLALLAIIFSRPFWPVQPTFDASELSEAHLILVDSSASMSQSLGQSSLSGGSSAMSAARDRAREILGSVGNDASVQVFSIDQTLKTLTTALPAATSHAELSAAIESIEASVLPLRYEDAARALESVFAAQEVPTHFQVHFISDFQQTAMPNRFADLIPERRAPVTFELSTYGVGAQQQSYDSSINLAIEQVQIVGQAARVGVRAYSQSATSGANSDSQVTSLAFDVRVRVGDGAWRTTSAEIEPNGRVTAEIDGLEFAAVQNRVEVELLLDDLLAEDNYFYHVENRAAPQPLLLLTENPFGPSALYLSALFPDQLSEQTVSQNVGRNFVAQPQALSGFDTRTLSRYSWVLIDDIGSIDSRLASELAAYIESGGAVFAAAGDLANSLGSLPILDLPIGSSRVDSGDGRFLSIANVDQGHPALNETTGWGELRFENWLEIDPTESTSVLVTLETGTPVLTETSLGRGKLVLFTSSLDNQWNNLPVKPLFVAMMRNMAEYLSDAEDIEPRSYAGDTLRLNADGNSAAAGQLIAPDGEAVLALGGRLQNGQLTLAQTGFYQAYTGSGEYLIGVNLDTRESDLTPVPDDRLQRWQNLANQSDSESGTDLGSASAITSGQIFDEQIYDGLWYWLLIIATLVILFETAMANMRLAESTGVIKSRNNPNSNTQIGESNQ